MIPLQAEFENRTIQAINSYGENQAGRFLKLQFENGNPYIKCIDSFSLFDTIVWYLVPDIWSPFSLQKIAGVAQTALANNNQNIITDHLVDTVQVLNRKIGHYNYNHIDRQVAPISIDSIFQRLVARHEAQPEVMPPDDLNRADIAPRGIYNDGNSCYLNSAIQALRHCLSFRYGGEYRGTVIGKALEDVFQSIEAVPAGEALDPAKMNTLQNLLLGYRFGEVFSGRQEDANELLTHILRASNPIQYQDADGVGQFTHPHISVPAPQPAGVPAERLSVQGLLNTKVIAFRDGSPDFLPITMGRFDDHGNKVSVAVYPSPEIDVMVTEGINVVRFCRYRLRSVVLHAGDDARYGHYTTAAKNDDGTWTHFDDSKTQMFHPDAGQLAKIQTEGALFFYEKIERQPAENIVE